MLAIDIENLTKKYGAQTALDIDHLHIDPGTLTGIVGNNGAGKTTLFRLLLDLISPSKGEARLGGQNVMGGEHWKQLTGSYLDEGFLIDFMNPGEYFRFIGKLHGMGEGSIAEYLEPFSRFMGEELLDTKKYIRQLSTGNKQKVGIIAAMFINPELLILDEPFNYLDPSSQILIKRMLDALSKARKTTILISSHNLNHLIDICDRVILLEKGKIIKDLSPSRDDIGEVERYFSLQAAE